ncbi:signal peptide peptidase SppA [uncultured Maribacter sp.]|uniref:signal peptide peptidase SppA n=1 Tax=uncultured Maribacter sp. TaxID=431308 RepID=UPI00262260D8|nr:signal peptide peptidase SppA [uncultured Maribacter sp.]
MNFLRNLLAAILGCIIAFGIVFIMFVIFIALSSSNSETVEVKPKSILELQLQQPINDYVGGDEENPFKALFQKSEDLDRIIHAIKVAKNDKDLVGISINNNFLMSGWAQTQSIRKALEDFKTSGKFIYSYGDFYMQKDYYLASVSDSVFLNPVGVLDFKGLSTEVLFYKDLQEKTGVKMEVIRHGKYKSAVEPYLNDTMSDANRTQIKELIGSVWNSVVDDIALSRNMTVEDMNTIADTLGGRMPKHAKASKLIDAITYYDEYEKKLKNAAGIEEDKEINLLSIQEYSAKANTIKLHKGEQKIAVIYAQGEILYGEGSNEVIGQGLINEAIIKARDDEKIKAIVLRVNSPGGSALTSDIIWREVMLAKEVKPVVVSMGNVAASGGYYIAAGADKIFAEPTTITGSIGVFGTIPNVNELATDIGINAEQVGTNKNSVGYSVFEPMSDNFRGEVQESIETTYTTFLEKVSSGRGISMAQADSIAQGRVWSGVDAKRVGLVDELGTLEDAINAAAALANLEKYGIKKFPKYKTGIEKLMEDIGGASIFNKEEIISKEIGPEGYAILKEIKKAMNQKGVQVRMPYTLDIK